MLISCPECKAQISNKAYLCPHCGYPIGDGKTKRPVKSTKRMRLPNGFGSISEVKDHYIRKPFYARVMKGKKPNGKPIYKSLKPVAYFKTYNEAYMALVEYNKNPYDLDNDMTCNELYQKWIAIKSQELSAGRLRSITSAWRYSHSLWGYHVMEIKSFHVKQFLEDQNITNPEGKSPSAGVKALCKNIWDMLLDYAIECGLVDINESRKVKMPKAITKEVQNSRVHHLSFTDEEMNILWDNVDNDIVKLILIQCYSGWRPKELLSLQTENINLETNFMIGGMKTDNGRNRHVPIHPNIKHLVEYFYNESNTDLFNLNYDQYYKRFIKTMKQLNLNCDHSPHDARKQFITQAKKYNVDEYAIKRIVGHSIKDLTESVYTDRSDEWLYDEILKIK